MTASYDMSLRFARYFATTEHVNIRHQTYNGLPYTHHLMDVEYVLRRFLPSITQEPWNSPIVLAAWLHDVVEDCGIKIKVIAEMFGQAVGDLVWAVTDEPGPNRKTRKLLTYEKIRDTENAVVVKLADRIANVETGGELVGMYAKEHPDFKRNLHDAKIDPNLKPVVAAMWDHLDNLLGA